MKSIRKNKKVLKKKLNNHNIEHMFFVFKECYQLEMYKFLKKCRRDYKELYK